MRASGDGMLVEGMLSRLMAPVGKDLARTAGAERNGVKSHVVGGVLGGERKAVNAEGPGGSGEGGVMSIGDVRPLYDVSVGEEVGMSVGDDLAMGNPNMMA